MKTKTKSSLLIGIITLTTIFVVFAWIVRPVSAGPSIFFVFPSGGDDTVAIQTAFDKAIAAGPGSTVKLTPGQFYTNAIHVENFHGSFKGSGIWNTKIDVLKGLDDTEQGVVGLYGVPYLFTFVGGDVCISDLSINITPEKPAEPHEDPDDPAYDLIAIIELTGDISSQIEDVKLTGHEGTLVNPFTEKTFNVRVGVEYNFGTGTHEISKCRFDSIWGGISAFGLTNVDMKIKYNSIKRGTFGIINMDNDNSEFEITDNNIESSFLYGIWVWQAGMLVPALSPSEWCIYRNTIKASVFSDGIGLQDNLGAVEAVVAHNKIRLDDTVWGGIWTFGLRDAYIYNNRISGSGDYGIGCDFTDNCMFFGNIMTHLENNGAYFYQSNGNSIIGNIFSNNGGWGLFMFDSNDNYIKGNVFYKNDLGNIYDNGNNVYKWNWEF